jgi:hypothetical protein
MVTERQKLTRQIRIFTLGRKLASIELVRKCAVTVTVRPHLLTSRGTCPKTTPPYLQRHMPQDHASLPPEAHAPRPNLFEPMSGRDVHWSVTGLYCSTLFNGDTPSKPPMAYNRPAQGRQWNLT